jgi:hypothetical protein
MFGSTSRRARGPHNVAIVLDRVCHSEMYRCMRPPMMYKACLKDCTSRAFFYLPHSPLYRRCAFGSVGCRSRIDPAKGDLLVSGKLFHRALGLQCCLALCRVNGQTFGTPIEHEKCSSFPIDAGTVLIEYHTVSCRKVAKTLARLHASQYLFLGHGHIKCLEDFASSLSKSSTESVGGCCNGFSSASASGEGSGGGGTKTSSPRRAMDSAIIEALWCKNVEFGD